MTEALLPQWSDEAVAESFRAEIHARLEHNAAYRAREAAELEQVLRKHVLVELYEDDVHALDALVVTHCVPNDVTGALRDRLKLALEALL